MDINTLRNTYPTFFYHSYEIIENIDNYVLKYNFEIKGLKHFTPSYELDKKVFQQFDNDEVVSALVFSLGMVELVSYYKATCSKKVIVECGSLNEQQITWWKKLYYKGLGEFFYRNKIELSFNDFMQIEADHNFHKPTSTKVCDNSILVPIGGGKDSIVSLELLKKLDLPIKTFMINPHTTTINTSLIAFDNKDVVVGIKRHLDKGIIELNKQGFLNGHTPFSAIVAFSSVLCAYLQGIRYVALSNEDSANEASVKGSDVNHQYSKSFEFENDFREYLNLYIGDSVNYFSLLRPLSEYQIGQYFVNFPQYFSTFKSCNVGSKEDIWCNNCSKCLYVYILLSAFLPSSALIKIFKENLLEKVELLDTFKQLIGLEDEKPFECVGSYEEINFALINGISRVKDNEKLPFLYHEYTKTALYHQYKSAANPYQNYYNLQNNLEPIFDELVRKEMKIDA